MPSPIFEMPADVQDGLMTMLVGAVSPDGQNIPFTVITTWSNLWLSRVSSDASVIIDISGLVGKNSWMRETDILDKVFEMAHRAGWRDALMRPEGHAWPSNLADAVFVDNLKNPLAVIEAKSLVSHLVDAVARVQAAARILRARYGFVAAAGKLFAVDLASGATRELHEFPSPLDLGVHIDEQTASELISSTPASVVHCWTATELLDCLAHGAPQAVILDNTIPWGTEIPPSLRGIPLPIEETIDLQTTLLVLCATNKNMNRIVTVVPKAVIYSKRHTKARACLDAHPGLAGFVDLPAGVFLPTTSAPATLLTFGNYSSRTSGKVVAITLSSRGDIIEPESQAWFNDFKGGLQGKQMSMGFMAERTSIDSWVFALPRVLAVEETLNRLAQNLPLGELCEVFSGSAKLREESNSSRGTPTVRGRDLSTNNLCQTDLGRFRYERGVPDNARIRVGDVLLQKIGSHPKCQVVNEDLAGAVASNTVIILRPKTEVANPSLIAQFLRSNAGQTLLSATIQGVGAPTVSLSLLRALLVPILPDEVSRDLDGLYRIEQDLRARADRMESMRLSLFNADSIPALRENLSTIRQVSRAVAASVEQAETLDFQIRNFYPYPIAFSYRALAGLTSPHDLYKEQLRVAENLMAFIGSITLALIQPEDNAKSGLVLAEFWRGGMTPGKWKSVSERGASILRRYQNNNLATSVAGLWQKKGNNKFNENINALIEAKNDYKHDRGPTNDEEFTEAAGRVGAILCEVMQSLSIMTEYPIRLVRDIDVIRGTQQVVLQTLRYMGDHPGLAQEKLAYSKLLSKDDLYLQTNSEEWVSLFPFMTVHSCPRCQTREVYFVDYWNGDGEKARLKSFERGHTEDRPDIGEALGQWGRPND